MVTLVATGLRKTFPGVLALNNVDLTLSSGKIHGLIGANGAGKSTTLNTISGILKPRQGRILLDGEDITQLPAQLQ